MSAKVIKGKPIADEMQAELKTEIDGLIAKGFTPKLSVVLVGDDPADVVCAGAPLKAFLAMSHLNEVLVFDASSPGARRAVGEGRLALEFVCVHVVEHVAVERHGEPAVQVEHLVGVPLARRAQRSTHLAGSLVRD